MALAAQVEVLLGKGVSFPRGFHQRLTQAEGGCPHAMAKVIIDMNEAVGDKHPIAAIKTALRAFMVQQVVGTKKANKRELDKIFTTYFGRDEYTATLKSQMHMTYHKASRPPSSTCVVVLRTAHKIDRQWGRGAPRSILIAHSMYMPRTADGEEHTLHVETQVELRHMQRQLCTLFHKSFPFNAASFAVNGKTYDDFGDKPFSDVPSGARVQATVAYERTTDMYW